MNRDADLYGIVPCHRLNHANVDHVQTTLVYSLPEQLCTDPSLVFRTFKFELAYTGLCLLALICFPGQYTNI